MKINISQIPTKEFYIKADIPIKKKKNLKLKQIYYKSQTLKSQIQI